MTKKIFIIATLLIFLQSCSSKSKKMTVAISAVTTGLVKNSQINFPVYLTDKLEKKEEVIAKTSKNVFIVYTGHLLKPDYTKEQNEALLKSLKNYQIDLVNLSQEDFIIADLQKISFEHFPQLFINSSVIDLNEDSLATKPNVVSYHIVNNAAFIGISDKKTDKKLPVERFIVSDYVMAILKAKKLALKEIPEEQIESFVIIHTLGGDINEVMERLPPTFINSLAN